MVKSDRMSRIMQSFILLGSYKNQEDYLRSFQKKHSIPDYFVLRYQEAFKIADARTLQKTLGVKLHGKEERMIIIARPTTDAQSAILKTLEELPEKTYVFFLCSAREDILPTIASRSSFIMLESENIPANPTIEEKIKDIVMKKENIGSLFSLMDLLGVTPEESELEAVVLSLRKVMLDEMSKNSQYVGVLFTCLKMLDKNYRLTKTNNINKRMALEDAFLIR